MSSWRYFTRFYQHYKYYSRFLSSLPRGAFLIIFLFFYKQLKQVFYSVFLQDFLPRLM